MGKTKMHHVWLITAVASFTAAAIASTIAVMIKKQQGITGQVYFQNLTPNPATLTIARSQKVVTIPAGNNMTLTLNHDDIIRSGDMNLVFANGITFRTEIMGGGDKQQRFTTMDTTKTYKLSTKNTVKIYPDPVNQDSSLLLNLGSAPVQ